MSPEWQPVRIKPASKGRPHSMYVGKFSKPRDEMTGKIVRVRPTTYRHGYTCSTGVVLEVHPDDAVNILGADGDRMVLVCEHQILAD